jgi:regulator of nucleoside diphosphate kinase
MSDRIFVTKSDLGKLRSLLESRHAGYSRDRPYLDKLEEELDRAEIVEPYAVAHDVVTMNSKVRLRDLDSGEVNEYRLVFPSRARSKNNVSVLAPIGTAILGYRAGHVVEWQVPKGIRRLQILEVVYQPEAAELAVLS